MSNRSWPSLLVHITAIIIVFILPEMFMAVGTRHPVPPVGYVKVALFVTVFYVEYYLVLPHCFKADARFSYWRFCRANLLLIALSVAALFAASEILPEPFMGKHPHWTMLVRDTAMVLLTIGLSFAINVLERIHRHDVIKREADLESRRQELAQLKSQLNPHFLFNSLNTIYALTEFDTERARMALHKLSRLLRYALYEADHPKVELSSELHFIEDYVELMKMRIGPAVKLTLDLNPGSMAEAEIAPMLMVVLVENAFKHGNTGLPGSYISISVNSPAPGLLQCTVANDVNPDKPKLYETSGVGLVNLRRRLELIYGPNASLDINSTPTSFTASLNLNLTQK